MSKSKRKFNNAEASREAAIYCARTNAKIRNGSSVWTYFDEDGECQAKAWMVGDQIRVKVTRL